MNKNITEAAMDVIDQYSLKRNSLKIISRADNAIFKVIDDNNKKYALRLKNNSLLSKSSIESECEWLSHLNRLNTISVPTPIRNIEDEWVCDVDLNGNSYVAVVMSWVEGRSFTKRIDTDLVRVGEKIGELHETSKQWSIPENFHRPHWGY